jgi:hypothetical protein
MYEEDPGDEVGDEPVSLFYIREGRDSSILVKT